MTSHKPITNGLALIKLLRDKDAPVTRDDTADGVAELIDEVEFQTDRNDALEARIEALTEALAFYADRNGWNQPPVKTREGLLTVEYENHASKIQRDRGAKARAALTPTPIVEVAA